MVKFFRKRKQKQVTRETYAYHLLNYYKATGLTPTEAIEEAHKEEDTIKRLSDRSIEDHQIEYVEYLENQKASLTSIQTGLTMVRTFYSNFDVILPKPPVIRPDQEGDEVMDTTEELPGLEEIKKAMDKATPLYKSIIVLMASSGMGRGEILRLTIQDLINAISRYADITIDDLQDIDSLRKKLPEKIGPLEWKIYRAKMRHKNRKKYITFSTPESLDYLLRYLELVRAKPQSSAEMLYLYKKGTPMTNAGFDDYFRTLNSRCGWGKRGKQVYFRSHSLRKFFTNQLVNSSLGFNNTNWLLGHEPLNKTDASYFKPNPQVMYDLYYNNMDLVTIFSTIEVHDKTNERVTELETQIEQMRKANEEMARSIQQMALQSQNPKP